MELFDKFIRVLKAFEQEYVDYILIGGFAVVLHGLPRLTQDVDVFIRPTVENIDKLRKALLNVFEDPSIHEITLDELNRYPVIRYGTPDGFSIDLIVNLGEAFSFDDIHFEERKIEGINLKIATPESLIEMKKNTMRETDQYDINFLREKIRKGEEDGD